MLAGRRVRYIVYITTKVCCGKARFNNWEYDFPNNVVLVGLMINGVFFEHPTYVGRLFGLADFLGRESRSRIFPNAAFHYYNSKRETEGD